MSLSYEQFVAATSAELVGGNLIVGAAAGRKKVGSLSDDGVFSLTDEGRELIAQIEADAAAAAAAVAAPTKGKGKAAAAAAADTAAADAQ